VWQQIAFRWILLTLTPNASPRCWWPCSGLAARLRYYHCQWSRIRILGETIWSVLTLESMSQVHNSQRLAQLASTDFANFVASVDHLTMNQRQHSWHAFVTSRVDYCNALYAGFRRPSPISCHECSMLSRTWSATRRGSIVVWRDSCIGWTYQRESHASLAYHCMHGQTPRYLADHLTQPLKSPIGFVGIPQTNICSSYLVVNSGCRILFVNLTNIQIPLKVKTGHKKTNFSRIYRMRQKKVIPCRILPIFKQPVRIFWRNSAIIFSVHTDM